MTKSKIIAATVAAVTLTGALVGTTAPAFAWKKHHHHGFGIGLAIGSLAAAAAASSAYYADPVECRYVKRYNRWGELRVVKICDDDGY